jgi:hypothetical protein
MAFILKNYKRVAEDRKRLMNLDQGIGLERVFGEAVVERPVHAKPCRLVSIGLATADEQVC